MAMKINSTFCRSLKPMLSSSFSFGMQDAFHGPLFGIMKQCHNIPQTEPFVLTNPSLSTDPVFRWTNPSYCCKKLKPGMILVKDFINLVGQVEIVNMCERWGVDHGGFYRPYNQSGAELRLDMMCFGRNWDPVTRYKNPYRRDGSEPPPIPNELISFIKDIFIYGLIDMDGLPSISPDVCIVNSYSSEGRLGLHQDCDESFESLVRGLPVISISIGDPAEFWYGETRDENKLNKVLLESGDVLIFGGKSRLIYHGVKRILHELTRPIARASRLIGRLNVTLRQF